MRAQSNLQIDGKRLWDDLMATAQIGATAKGGICRLTLTDLDRQVRDWFKAQCEALGATVTVDELGTMFARRPGRNATLPPIAMGSHLDTQPTGGKFDGALGVLGALEALRTLALAGYETNAPIEVVNWTNEEGARFAPPMLASGVFAGVFTRDYAFTRTDRDGKTFGDELRRIGYRGSEQAGAHKFSGLFELHIEQGPILEAEGRMIGIVQGVQGMRWYEITVSGQEAHTGATPMHLRKNALLGAARLVDRIDAIAREDPDAVGTVGLIENRPNSRNVVPGEVFFTVDFRHPDDAVLDAIETKLRAALGAILQPLGLSFTATRIWDSPAVKFAPELIECVRLAAHLADPLDAAAMRANRAVRPHAGLNPRDSGGFVLEDFPGQNRVSHDTRFPSMFKGYLGRLGLSSTISRQYSYEDYMPKSSLIRGVNRWRTD